MNIPLIKPYVDENIKKKVLEVLDSGYLTEGNVTKQFEEKFSSYIGCKHSIAITSCTTGLEVALRVLEIGKGDEVIVPDYTYPATAAVAPIVGAKSVIVDVDKDTMNIDYDKIEEAITEKTKVVMPVSEFGNPLDYDRLRQIKEKYGLYIVEDAACSVGAEFKNKKVGNWADISVFSFHPRKFITTGEGGMITTNNDEWAEWINSYKHFGINTKNAEREVIKFDIIGTNYKLSNILSAVGLGQLERIDELLKRRIELASNYYKLLDGINKIIFPHTTIYGKHSFQSFCIFVEERNRILKEMRANGIEVQIGTYALHKHKAFFESERIVWGSELSGSTEAFEKCLTLPLYHDLSFDQQQYICEKLIGLIRK